MMAIEGNLKGPGTINEIEMAQKYGSLGDCERGNRPCDQEDNCNRVIAVRIQPQYGQHPAVLQALRLQLQHFSPGNVVFLIAGLTRRVGDCHNALVKKAWVPPD